MKILQNITGRELTKGQEVNPSIHFLNLLNPTLGSRGGAYPSRHWARGGVHPGGLTSPSQGHKVKVKVKFICIAHFMYKTIQSALHKILAVQQGAEEALKISKRI